MSNTVKWIIGVVVAILLGWFIAGQVSADEHENQGRFNPNVTATSTCDGWSVTADPQNVPVNWFMDWRVTGVTGTGSGNWETFDYYSWEVEVTWTKYVFGVPNPRRTITESGEGRLVKPKDCPEPTPTPEPTPEVTPEATPTPFDFARDATDKCVNLDGVQATIPQGMFLNDKTQCEDIVKTSAPASTPAITELPATGDNSLITYLALALGLIGIGLPVSLWANRKLKS